MDNLDSLVNIAKQVCLLTAPLKAHEAEAVFGIAQNMDRATRTRQTLSDLSNLETQNMTATGMEVYLAK